MYPLRQIVFFFVLGGGEGVNNFATFYYIVPKAAAIGFPVSIASAAAAEAVGDVSIIMGAVCCRYGLEASGGAKGVGKATTNSVVVSILAILGLDVVFTYFQVVA